MLTEEMRERAVELLNNATNMGCGPAACEYQVGEYWVLCEQVQEFLEDLLDIRAGGAARNPMFETGKTT